MEFLAITLKRKQGNGKGNNMHETTIYAYHIVLPSSRNLLGFKTTHLLGCMQGMAGVSSAFPTPSVHSWTETLPKTSSKIPQKNLKFFSLRKKRSTPFYFDFFSSFIVPDLQPSKLLHFSLLQALERAPISLEISFPINSPPHFPCKLIIFSFQLTFPPRIHMDSWWAARSPN